MYDAWESLAGSIRVWLDERRYELATLAAARRLGSDYCLLAHAAVLRDRHFGEEAMRAIMADWRHAGLDEADQAVMDFADRMAADPTGVTDVDIDTPRRHGLSDADIFHIVLTVAACRFVTAVLAVAGAEPDAHLIGQTDRR